MEEYMARKFDLTKLKHNAVKELNEARAIVKRVEGDTKEYLFARWVCKMVAVNIHETWERYVEDRLAAALNHSPKPFLDAHDVRGVKNISAGFAYFIVRSGGRFFDFRSVSDLLSKGDDWLSKAGNPFRKLSKGDANYIDALAAIRNFVTHGSEAARKSYRLKLNALYGIKSAPAPGEFLLSIDYRSSSMVRYKPRIYGLIVAVENAIRDT
jgi:hypothetical protein